MKKQHFKFTALCMLGLGMSQMALAETAPRQTLPSFQAKDIPAMCNAKIADVKKQLKTFENKPLKNETAAAPVLAEWDRIFASFEDFYGPIGLYLSLIHI